MVRATLLKVFIPLFQLFENLSQLDSIQRLVILLVSFLIPPSVWIMTSFVRQIPIELEEAAQIDGANVEGLMAGSLKG